MKLRHVLSLLAAALFPLFEGCNKAPIAKKNEAQSNQSAPSSDLARTESGLNSTNQALTLLRAFWPVGNRYVYRMEMDQRRTDQGSGTPQPATEDLKLGLTYALSVEAETSNGGRELELEFLANDLEIKVGSEIVIHFNTAELTTNGIAAPMPFRKMIGSKALLRVGPEGRVEKVLGHEIWLKSVTGETPGPAGEMVAQQFNQQFFQQLVDFGRGLPDRPIKTGESWPNRDEVQSPDLGVIIMNSTMSFTGWEQRSQQRLAVLSAAGNLHSEPGRSTNSPPRMTIDHGTVQGKTWFDPVAGTLVESLVDQTIQIKATVNNAPSAGPAAGPLTSDVVQKISLKLVELGRFSP